MKESGCKKEVRKEEGPRPEEERQYLVHIVAQNPRLIIDAQEKKNGTRHLHDAADRTLCCGFQFKEGLNGLLLYSSRGLFSSLSSHWFTV